MIGTAVDEASFVVGWFGHVESKIAPPSLVLVVRAMRRRDRELTDPAAILALIESADSCRLGLIDNLGTRVVPYVVALNYGYEPKGQDGLHGTFWFHGAKEGRKLDLIRRHPEACVELDGGHEPVRHPLGCGWGMKYTSVFAAGKAALVEEPAELRHGLECLMTHYLRLWGPPTDVEHSQPFTFAENVLSMTAVFRMDVESLTAKQKG